LCTSQSRPAGVDRHRLRDEGRGGRDAFLQRGREHERLERGACLPLALDGEVELALAEVVAAEHGEDSAVPGVDRNQRGVGPVGLVSQCPIEFRAIFWSFRSIVV
jgi:hypothetical protein